MKSPTNPLYNYFRMVNESDNSKHSQTYTLKKECNLNLLGYIVVATNKEWAAPSSSEVGDMGGSTPCELPCDCTHIWARFRVFFSCKKHLEEDRISCCRSDSFFSHAGNQITRSFSSQGCCTVCT